MYQNTQEKNERERKKGIETFLQLHFLWPIIPKSEMDNFLIYLQFKYIEMIEKGAHKTC